MSVVEKIWARIGSARLAQMMSDNMAENPIAVVTIVRIFWKNINKWKKKWW